ncbi:carbohydrate ABC transporter permease [Paenibacillus fonticola]|uniref:carbohydrate ABC transporter permease n=1 Tax=Paenibacillus fonticola TaxID=379896 RepID=UPI00035D558C|nr:carbohydrate ABC transporter permease [Paenibacillus fonticola]
MESNVMTVPQMNPKSKFNLKKAGKVLLSLALAAYAIIQVYPLFWLLLFSFKDNNEIFGGNVLGLPEIWRWSNYTSALTTGDVGIYFINSIIVTAVTILLSSVMLAATSYAIVRMYWKLNNLFLTYFLIGLMVPIHATLLPLFVILRNMHMLNTYWSLIIPYVAFALPMGIFILTGFLNSIPRELEEAACIDGCSIYKIFGKIIIPLLRPALATVAIFTYMNTWNELMFANTFINSEKLKTLTVGIMSLAGQHTTDWGPIGAGLVIATIPTLLIYVLLSDQVQKSLIVGSVKG